MLLCVGEKMKNVCTRKKSEKMVSDTCLRFVECKKKEEFPVYDD